MRGRPYALTLPRHIPSGRDGREACQTFQEQAESGHSNSREFELPGEDAIIRKEGQRLIIETVPPRSLLAVLATLETLDENVPPIEDPPAEPMDL
jgi:antitoxin VapB